LLVSERDAVSNATRGISETEGKHLSLLISQQSDVCEWIMGRMFDVDLGCGSSATQKDLNLSMLLV